MSNFQPFKLDFNHDDKLAKSRAQLIPVLKVTKCSIVHDSTTLECIVLHATNQIHNGNKHTNYINCKWY